jgi:hypothetical protein
MNLVSRQLVVALPGLVIGPSQDLSLSTKNITTCFDWAYRPLIQYSSGGKKALNCAVGVIGQPPRGQRNMTFRVKYTINIHTDYVRNSIFN